jgi:hypothetical protein
MLLGDSAFSAAAFSAYPDTRNFIGITGMQLTTALGRVSVETPYNFNVTVFPDGMQLTTALSGPISWINVNTQTTNIWTEIVT